MAVDVGTVNTLVYVAGRGVVVDEPSAVAFRRSSGGLVGVGKAADALVGREPPGIEVIHPLRDGVVTDLEAATVMLEAFMRRARRRHAIPLRSDAVVCVPSGATGIEREALRVAIGNAGRQHHKTLLLEEPVAAALGTGADLSNGSTALVVDIGGGTTEAAAVLGGHFVASIRASSLRVAGNEMDGAIVEAIRKRLGLAVSQRSAERLKMTLGLNGGEEALAQVGGIDLVTSTPRSAVVSATFVADALEHPVGRILGAVRGLLGELPPDVAEEIYGRGVWLAGGGALLPGLLARVQEDTKIGTRVAEEPLRCVVRGLAMVLDYGLEGTDAA